jgi:hypothetical protein
LLTSVVPLLTSVVVFGVALPDFQLFWLFAGSLAFSTLYYMLIFDDFTIWNSHRAQHWILTKDKLQFSDGDDTVFAPLSEITGTRRWFWWGLRIKFSNGRSVELNYVSHLGAVRKLIDATRRDLT